MHAITLRDAKPGEFVKRTADAKTVYVKGAYDRATKRFTLTDWDDANHEIFVKADKTVFVGFDF